MVYKFRVILDAEEDIFRDIAILAEDTLEDLHNAIFNSFGFDGMEVASFYTCDDTWNQEDEIAMFDTGDIPGDQKTMSDYFSIFGIQNIRKHIIAHCFLVPRNKIGRAHV